jgi:hypothetical protein
MAKGEADTTLGNRAHRPPERMTDERRAGPVVRLGCDQLALPGRFATDGEHQRSETILYRRDDN